MRVTYARVDEARAALREYLEGLGRGHPEVERVVLFGSFARGDCVPGSDVDLLLVLSRSELPFLDRIPAYLPNRFPLPLQVFPYTVDELERMEAEGNRFLRGVMSEGVEVYRREG